MRDYPYLKFSENELILRDFLAVDRTVLANERTFLAYIRTALTLFGVGASFLQFFGLLWIKLIGVLFIPVSVAVFLLGAVRFQKTKIVINRIKNKDNPGTKIK